MRLSQTTNIVSLKKLNKLHYPPIGVFVRDEKFQFSYSHYSKEKNTENGFVNRRIMFISIIKKLELYTIFSAKQQ